MNTSLVPVDLTAKRAAASIRRGQRAWGQIKALPRKGKQRLEEFRLRLA